VLDGSNISDSKLLIDVDFLLLLQIDPQNIIKTRNHNSVLSMIEDHILWLTVQQLLKLKVNLHF
jgi:hypothetical protein